MRTYIKSPTAAALEDDNMPVNFACFGRQQYRAGGGRPSGFSLRPYYPPGPIRGDWSWKPDAQAKSQIAEGNSKCTAFAFDQYLAALSPDERYRVLANKKEYVAAHKELLESLERTFQDQMEGYEDKNNI